MPGVNKASKPANYGEFLKTHDGGLEWYTWMCNSRLEQHLCFHNRFRFVNEQAPVRSVLEFGCGLAVGYAEFFSDIRYVGVDISEKEIAWCKQNRPNPKHDFWACDFIEAQFDETFDLVFSQGTIDNTYDMDSFIRAAVKASKRWIYITAYRGFFPNLAEHKISYSEPHGCYYNDISPLRVYEALRAYSCHDIAVFPSYTGRKDIPFETLIIARKNGD